jgi:hypothetical protein
MRCELTDDELLSGSEQLECRVLTTGVSSPADRGAICRRPSNLT